MNHEAKQQYVCGPACVQSTNVYVYKQAQSNADSGLYK